MRKGLLISTMLVSVFGLGASAEASNQCLQTPSCESLGYTQTSCVDNNGVKCPFGNKYFCVCPAKYAYSCSGTGYAGGSGTACGGKYTECTCASGYEWKDGSCVQTAIWGQCTGYAGKKCKIGDILFSDGTCAADKVTGKTPIAVVVYISSEGCGQALALKEVEGTYIWSNVSTIPNINIIEDLRTGKDYASCKNTYEIVSAGNKNTYPAAWAAYEYKTEGTNAGDWCLVAASIASVTYDNSELIETTIQKVEGDSILGGRTYWSSTKRVFSKIVYYRYTEMNSNSVVLDVSLPTSNSFHVRPVIEF